MHIICECFFWQRSTTTTTTHNVPPKDAWVTRDWAPPPLSPQQSFLFRLPETWERGQDLQEAATPKHCEASWDDPRREFSLPCFWFVSSPLSQEPQPSLSVVLSLNPSIYTVSSQVKCIAGEIIRFFFAVLPSLGHRQTYIYTYTEWWLISQVKSNCQVV